MVRPTVHSRKHIVQFPLDQITTGTLQSISLVSGQALQDSNLAGEVVEGSSVKAVFVELWLDNTSNLGESIVTVTKDMNFSTGPTFAESATLFTYSNKKNVLFTHQGLTSNDVGGNPVKILGGWIKIPKSKQRFGLGDTLNFNIANVSSNDLNRCGMAIYKEYT